MKPTAIIVGDLHIRDDTPTCRTDNFWETQLKKFRWLRQLWEDNDEPLMLQAGDVFHKWKSSPLVISTAFNELPPMITVPGNHDLPSHSMNEYEKSSLFALESANLGWKILIQYCPEVLHRADPPKVISTFKISGIPWNESTKAKEEAKEGQILISHKMILEDKSIIDGISAKDYLKANPGFPLIVTGHNHQPITEEYKGRRLVNPGSFTRQTASETHSPRVYFWYASTNRIKAVYVPHELEHVSREHLEAPKERDKRLEAFVESLKDVEMGEEVRFKENLLKYLKENGVNVHVRNRVLESIEGETT